MREFKITRSITSRESHSIERYLQEIDKEQLLTAEQEAALAKRCRLGDSVAREKLVRANLRFVISVAKQYQHLSAFQLGDLVNEGNIGIIRAADKFDETRGFKFITYAVWWIRQAIFQAIAQDGKLVRLPLNKTDSIIKINRAIAKFEGANEREPTEEELADILGMKIEDVIVAKSLLEFHSSLDAPMGDDPEKSNGLYDIIPAKQEIDPGVILTNRDMAEIVQSLLNGLTFPQRTVMEIEYGIGRSPGSMEEAGDILGVGKVRAAQIRDKVIFSLKNHNRIQRALAQRL